MCDAYKKDTLRMLRAEMRNDIDREVKEKFQVPGIIGEKNCAYTSFCNYVS